MLNFLHVLALGGKEKGKRNWIIKIHWKVEFSEKGKGEIRLKS